eukprot:scaffold283335_cov30-Tisochrysis_lutea.AAC.4
MRILDRRWTWRAVIPKCLRESKDSAATRNRAASYHRRGSRNRPTVSCAALRPRPHCHKKRQGRHEQGTCERKLLRPSTPTTIPIACYVCGSESELLGRQGPAHAAHFHKWHPPAVAPMPVHEAQPSTVVATQPSSRWGLVSSWWPNALAFNPVAFPTLCSHVARSRLPTRDDGIVAARETPASQRRATRRKRAAVSVGCHRLSQQRLRAARGGVGAHLPRAASEDPEARVGH